MVHLTPVVVLELVDLPSVVELKSGASTGPSSGAGTPVQLPLVMELEPGAITSGNGVEPNATASGSGAGTWCIYLR